MSPRVTVVRSVVTYVNCYPSSIIALGFLSIFLDLFENESIKCIVWNAFRSNKASCRIAEKLGGK